MKKFQNESELVKALHVGAVYAKKRGYGEVESRFGKIKVEFIYRVLVEDKLVQPLAKIKSVTPICGIN